MKKLLLITIALIGLMPFNLNSKDRQKKEQKEMLKIEVLKSYEPREEESYFNGKKKTLDDYKKQKYGRQSLRGVSKKILEIEDLEVTEKMIDFLDFTNADEESKEILDRVFQDHPALKTAHNLEGSEDNVTSPCNNGVKDEGEEATDCGGSFCNPCNVSPDEEIYSGSFENSFDEWVRNGDQIDRVEDKTHAKDGVYSVKLRGREGKPVQMVLNQNLSDKTLKELTFQFSYKLLNLDNGDAFVLEYSNGTEWEVLTVITKDTNNELDKYYTESITLDAGAYTFSATSTFRIRLLNFKQLDYLHIDEISITKKTYLDNSSEYTDGDSNKELNIFPNPTKDILNVDYPLSFASLGIEIKIYNATGIRVFESSERLEMIDISHLETGFYMLEVSNGYEENYRKKFVKR